ncbi:MAG TPA: short-chain fatty acyl-CoA regulator family protein [Asanoa sp.]|nr:short-chain fatty acyl-CoA regulator family protein [Asanoa sp.]
MAPRMGVRLRRFREQRDLTQAALARALGISASYVNQIESDQRPLTSPVLLRLVEAYGVDPREFSAEAADRLVAQLRDVFGDPGAGEPVTLAEARELTTTMPAVARFVVELHSRYRRELARSESIAGQIFSEAPPTAYEEVRDLFYANRNYFDQLDTAAEALFARAGLTTGDTAGGLVAYLADRHRIRVEELPEGDGADLKRRFDPRTRTLSLSPLLSAGQRAFQLAAHLATIEAADEIDRIVADADLLDDDTRVLARIGLSSYFAGATILPYQQFRDAAESLRYDIDLLRRRFRVGFETIAHRLSTLQRPQSRGVPFFFVRVDRAGNISKRQSATDFHFSRVGGSCPLWSIYAAFAEPGTIRAQLAEMPDGRGYLWVARTVSRHTGGYGSPTQAFAIGLGCDLRHASRLVYADGLDLNNPAARTPIGPGCKVCERPACPQRAFPAIGASLRADPGRTRFAPYAME